MSMLDSFPVAKAALQSAVIGAFSNVLAQIITAVQENKTLVIDWAPILKFFVYSIIITPPNYMWQSFLEDTFPAYPSKKSPGKAGKAGKEEKKQPKGEAEQRQLSIPNTVFKLVLDQTVGAAVNTFLFSSFMHGVKASNEADWAAVVVTRSLDDFWGLMRASWTFWPFVAVFNYTLVTSVQARNLVGSLAGAAWGVYMSLVAAK